MPFPDHRESTKDPFIETITSETPALSAPTELILPGQTAAAEPAKHVRVPDSRGALNLGNLAFRRTAEGAVSGVERLPEPAVSTEAVDPPVASDETGTIPKIPFTAFWGETPQETVPPPFSVEEFTYEEPTSEEAAQVAQELPQLASELISRDPDYQSVLVDSTGKTTTHARYEQRTDQGIVIVTALEDGDIGLVFQDNDGTDQKHYYYNDGTSVLRVDMNEAATQQEAVDLPRVLKDYKARVSENPPETEDALYAELATLGLTASPVGIDELSYLKEVAAAVEPGTTGVDTLEELAKNNIARDALGWKPSAAEQKVSAIRFGQLVARSMERRELASDTPGGAELTLDHKNGGQWISAESGYRRAGSATDFHNITDKELFGPQPLGSANVPLEPYIHFVSYDPMTREAAAAAGINVRDGDGMDNYALIIEHDYTVRRDVLRAATNHRIVSMDIIGGQTVGQTPRYQYLVDCETVNSLRDFILADELRFAHQPQRPPHA